MDAKSQYGIQWRNIFINYVLENTVIFYDDTKMELLQKVQYMLSTVFY